MFWLCTASTSSLPKANRPQLYRRHLIKDSFPSCRLGNCLLALTLLVGAVLPPAFAESVKVRFQEGTQRGFLVLRNQKGAAIANGEYSKVVHGERVTLRLVFRFRDGSLHQENAVYVQGRTLRLLTDHLLQKGPSFPSPVDLAIDVPSGRIVSRFTGKDGQPQSREDHMDLPPDLANGIIFSLIMNLDPAATPVNVSYLAMMNKPRVLHLRISNAGEQTFTVGGMRRHATDFMARVELGGLTGIVAPIVGKQPAPVHFWVLGGDSPVFIREEGQLFEGGPVWRMEQVSPTFAVTPTVADVEPAPEIHSKSIRTAIANR